MDLEECGRQMEEDGFRLRAKTFLLTYPTHIHRGDLLQHIRKKEGCELVYVAIGQEVGKTGHEHTHVFVHRSKNGDSKNSRKWDVEDVHPNVRAPNSETHKARQMNYVFKQDADVLEWGDKPEFGSDAWETIIHRIQTATSWNSLIQDPTLASTVSQKLNWVKEVWNARPQKSLLAELEWWPGPLQAEQEKWLASIEAQTRRQVCWVIDTIGGLGKSDFGIWLAEQWHGGEVFLMDGGSVADQMHAYQGQALCVIDIPRDTDEKMFPYRIIENFKRGWASSTKYNSHVKRYKPAKVIVFSNTYPQSRKLSRDRWVVYDYSLDDPGPHYDLAEPVGVSQSP